MPNDPMNSDVGDDDTDSTSVDWDSYEPTPDTTYGNDDSAAVGGTGDSTDTETNTDPAPERNRRDDREQTYEDAFDDDDSGESSGSSGSNSSSGSSSSGGGPVSSDPSGNRGPSQEEREQTYEDAFDDPPTTEEATEEATRDQGVDDPDMAPANAPAPDDDLPRGDQAGDGLDDAPGASGGVNPPPDAGDRNYAGINHDVVEAHENVQEAKGGEVTGREVGGDPAITGGQEDAVEQLEGQTVIDLGPGDVETERVQQDGETVVRYTLTEDALDREQDARREAASEINTASDREYAGINRNVLDAYTGGDGVSETQEVLADRERPTAGDRETAGINRNVLDKVTGGDGVSETQEVLAERDAERMDIRGNTDEGILDDLAGSTDEAVGRFFYGSAQVANSDLGPGQRASAYTRLLTRNTLGPDVEDAIFQTPGQQFAGNPDQTAISGPAVNPDAEGTDDLLESGPQGELNTDVTDTLTEGRGLIPDETADGQGGGFWQTSTQELRSKQETRRENFEPAVEGTGDAVAGVTGSEKAGRVAEGVALFGTELANLPAGGLIAADTAVEVGSNLPRATRKYGAREVALTGAEVGGRVTQSMVTQGEENPYRFAGEVAGGVLAGTVAFKGIEKAGDVGRSVKMSNRETVEYEDITSDRGAEGDLPQFETDTDADTSQAVSEVETRAQDNPQAVTDRTGGDSALYHGTQDDFGGDIDVGEGASELPGLFTSPDASPIALSGLSSGFTRPSVKLSLPDPTGKSDRFVGVPGDRVEGMPEGRGAAGYELRDTETGDQVRGGLGRGEAKAAAADDADVEVRPDQATSGYQFLTEEAEPGTAYVRPSGQRTSELESIFAPESEFTKTGQVAVRVGRKQFPGTDTDIPLTGRKVPLDTYRRTDSQVTGDAVEADVDASPTEYRSIVSDLERRSRRDEGSVAATGGAAGGGAGVVTAPRGRDERSDTERRSGPSMLSDQSTGMAEDASPSGGVSSPMGTSGGYSPPTSLTSTPDSGSPLETTLTGSPTGTSTPGSPSGSGSGSGTSTTTSPPQSETSPGDMPGVGLDGTGDKTRRDFDGWADRVDRDLINPITGE